MTELPPIIERLDAHLAEADTLGQRGHINASRDVLVNVARSDATELRAELLRLQEERDETHRQIGANVEEARQAKLAAERWQQHAGDFERLYKEQVDALLEALKAIRDTGVHSIFDPLLSVCDNDCPVGIASKAIANVEGTE